MLSQIIIKHTFFINQNIIVKCIEKVINCKINIPARHGNLTSFIKRKGKKRSNFILIKVNKKVHRI